MQIAIIDLGIGNLRSVEQALHHVAPQADIVVTSDAAVINRADKVVMPGQGAIGTWLASLVERDLVNALKQTLSEKPLLGICVGMQVLFSRSDEDDGVDGFDLFDGAVRHFSNFHKPQEEQAAESRLKIPQMGWNQVRQTQDHPLWHNIKDDAYFYFVHSYCANLNEPCRNDKVIFGNANYGHEFIAAVGDKNTFAVQFHPEKSHHDGLQLLNNFVQWNGTI